jgi:hypothetical protein
VVVNTSIMSSSSAWSLVLYQDAADSDPIAGRLIGEDGRVVEFTGWLAFAAAIEEARSRQRTTAAHGALDSTRPHDAVRPSE